MTRMEGNRVAIAYIPVLHQGYFAYLKMLEKEGFAHSGLVDIFDGGPTMTCKRDAIRTIASARTVSLKVAELDDSAEDRLISTDSIAAFRAVRAPVFIDDDSATVSSATASLLGLAPGASIQVSPLS